MEKNFDQWKKMDFETWEEFKHDKLERWLSPVKLDNFQIKEPDKRYEELMEKFRKNAETKPVTKSKVEDDPRRKGGFRGQKWFYELLMDLGVQSDSEFKTELLRYDIFQDDLKATIEVKTMTIGNDTVNIKETAWCQRPSLYVVAVKACDEDYLEFQFIGWLYGHDVYKLGYQPKSGNQSAFFYAYPSDLIGPRRLLNLLLEFSHANPFRKG